MKRHSHLNLKQQRLNNFFSNIDIVKRLEIEKLVANDSVTEFIEEPLLKTIQKYKNQPNILAI